MVGLQNFSQNLSSRFFKNLILVKSVNPKSFSKSNNSSRVAPEYAVDLFVPILLKCNWKGYKGSYNLLTMVNKCVSSNRKENYPCQQQIKFEIVSD